MKRRSSAKSSNLGKAPNPSLGAAMRRKKRRMIQSRITKCKSVEEFLENERDRIKKKLCRVDGNAETEENFDGEELDYLFRTICGLLSLNSEICERCQAFKSKMRTMDHAYGRVSVSHLKLETPKEHEATEISRKLHLSLVFEYVSCDFGKPPEVPSMFFEMLPIKDPMFQPDRLMDYGTLLKKAALLDKSLLGAFFTKLKKHLETVQVYWGKIDAWLSDTYEPVEFLEDLLQKQIEFPTEEQMYESFDETCQSCHRSKCNCSQRKCHRCKKIFANHEKGKCGSGRHEFFQHAVMTIPVLERPTNMEYSATFPLEKSGRDEIKETVAYMFGTKRNEAKISDCHKENKDETSTPTESTASHPKELTVPT